MNVALICPTSLLEKYGRLTRYHLVLPHLLGSKKYSDFYRERRRNGNFVILDNGAAEGVEFGPRHLHTLAREVEANEIVVPDTLGDLLETISKAKAFVPFVEPDFKYMAVLQGSTLQEVISCLHFYDQAPDMVYLTCIGIPRHLTSLNPRFRVNLTEFLIAEQFHLKYQFHYLGASSWLREISALQSIVSEHLVKNWDSSGFRGIDTSAPINMGLMGKWIHNDPHEHRIPNFFDITYDRYDQVMININQYLNWAETTPVIQTNEAPKPKRSKPW